MTWWLGGAIAEGYLCFIPVYETGAQGRQGTLLMAPPCSVVRIHRIGHDYEATHPQLHLSTLEAERQGGELAPGAHHPPDTARGVSSWYSAAGKQHRRHAMCNSMGHPSVSMLQPSW